MGHQITRITVCDEEFFMLYAGSESVVRLIDINGDGAEDVVFGIAQPSNLDNFLHQPQYCQQYQHGCLGKTLFTCV